MVIYPQSATRAWLGLLERILLDGQHVAPRGKRTLEVPQVTARIDMRRPVVRVPERKLSYAFLAAEALWILDGDDRVETIEPWNKRIAEFSDDGETFFGAYGPRFRAQLPYVAAKLAEDPLTRQAVIDLWRARPPGHATKDVPCTLNLIFQLRKLDPFDRRRLDYSTETFEVNERGNAWHLDCHVHMRSSDAHLGVPYDWFNEIMMALEVGRAVARLRPDLGPLEPGTLYWSAASGHLYEENWAAARAICNASNKIDDGPAIPDWALDPGADGRMRVALVECRDNDIHNADWRIRP